jgi:hypothetical protein
MQADQVVVMERGTFEAIVAATLGAMTRTAEERDRP